jgi:hypothetical protein
MTLNYQRWTGPRYEKIPVALYDTVRIESWGTSFGARSMDVGATGVVVKLNRTRVVVQAAPGKGQHGTTTWTVHPDVLRLLSRQIDRKCPVCDAQRGQKCRSEQYGRTAEHALMHRER